MSARRALLLAGACGFMLAEGFAPTAAFAQSSQPAAGGAVAIEEVVVTARRREESLQDVPLAVTMLPGEVLKDRGVASPQDLVSLTPGMQVYTRAGGTVYAVRGQSSSSGGSSAGVILYFAEVPGFASQFFDLQSVQVLKGPQGTLFGRVSSGGAVLYSPERPSGVLEGYATARAGDYENRELQFGVGGPLLGDKLAFRIAARLREQDGTFHSVYNDRRYGGIDDKAVRGSLLFRPVDNLENLTVYQWQQREPGPLPLILTAVNPNFAANNIPVAPQVAAQYGLACTGPSGRCPTWTQALTSELAAQRNRDLHEINSGAETASATREQILVNTTTWQATDWLTIKNIASVSQSRAYGEGKVYSSGSSLPFAFSYATDPSQETKGVSEELQFQGAALEQRLEWTVGGFYERNRNPIYSQTISLTKGGYAARLLTAANPACPAPGVSDGLYCHTPGTARVSRSRLRDQSTALFGQATYALTDKLKVTGGLRYTEDKSRFQGYASAILVPITAPVLDATVPPSPTAAPIITIDSGSDALTYTFAVDYHVTPDTLVYATTRTGHKAGGFNTQAPPAERTFDPEKITDYEVGLKQDFRAGELAGRFDVSAYYDKYQDIQVTMLGNAGGVLYPLTINAAAGEIKGLDVEGVLAVGAWLNVSAFYSFTDSRFTQLPAGTVLVENTLPYISKHRWGLSPTVRLAGFGAAWPDVSIAPKLYYQSEYFNLATDYDQRIPGRTLLDLRVDWRPAAVERLTLGLVVQNATDENAVEYYSAQYTSSGQNTVTAMPPRTWFLEATYKF